MHRASIGCPFTSTTFIVKGAFPHILSIVFLLTPNNNEELLLQALQTQQKDDCMSVMSEYE